MPALTPVNTMNKYPCQLARNCSKCYTHQLLPFLFRRNHTPYENNEQDVKKQTNKKTYFVGDLI